MKVRGNVLLFIVGACGLPALVGCAGMYLSEREPWRREAELACIQSGAVREGPSVTFVKAINGPGLCGADYPMRVAALGDPALLGFADDAPHPPRGAVSQIGWAGAGPGDYYGQAGQVDDYWRARPQGPAGEPVPLGRSEQVAPVALAPAGVTPAATLACPLVSKLDRFVSDKVQPAALRWFGQPVIEITQISAYSCRGMNGDPNASISEHAFGNALDIAAFTFADGRKVTVKDGWHGAPEEQGFLRDIHGGACEMFSTVLAPGSNAYHYDHMHVDLMRRSSRRVICEPTAIAGEVAAARAAARSGGRWRPAEATGSLGPGVPVRARAVAGRD
jgi:hypothetical protein